MSETQDENPPPPPLPATQQTPTQQTPHTVSTIKLPILKKREYDIWAMKMEHYLAHTDYPIWEVIQNGNGPVIQLSNTDGIHKGYEKIPKSSQSSKIHGAVYHLKNKSENSLRSLPSACYKLPNYEEQNHEWTDSGILQESVEQRKITGGGMDGILEIKMGKELKEEESKHCSGSDTQVNSCSNECKESYTNLKRLYDAQREQLSDASVEIKAYTQGLKKVEAQLVAHQQAQKEKDDLEVIVDKWNHSSKNLGKIVNYPMSASDKFGLGYGDYRYSGILSYENEVFQSVFKGNKSDFENLPLHKRLGKTSEMQAVPPPMTGNYLPSGPDIEIDDSQYTYGPRKSQPSESESQTTELDTCDSNTSTEPSELVSEPVVNESPIEVQPKVWSDAPIIEEYESDSDDEYVSVQIGLNTPSFANKQVKTPRENLRISLHIVKNLRLTTKNWGMGLLKAHVFVCGLFLVIYTRL
ncbi:hypothetical protein Tco_1004605 [Tanacetum coccineum]|uniref:Uncharacterized protein n=1 Tax=Tanacetum coccineum TaxID=301880 RepID=A0ABQ5FEU6_9ASTR